MKLQHLIFPIMFLFFGCGKAPQPKVPRVTPEPTVTSTPLPPPFNQEKASEGQQTFDSIKAQFPKTKIDVWGTANPSVKACMWIPASSWSELPDSKREALIEYLASKVPEIRGNPDQYVGIPRSAPVYGRFRSNIQGMRDRRIIIFTMVPKDGEWIQERTVHEE
jgi:hypothetical protein